MSTIAGKHGLEPKVTEAYADFFYEHLDQTDESDLNFLMRIAREHDALVTVKGQTLLFIGKGEGKTASGLPMLPLPITRTGKLTWSMTLATRGDYKSVEANWHNEETGQKEKVTTGEGSPIRKLRHTCATKEEARRAAKAKLDEVRRAIPPDHARIPVRYHREIPAPDFRTGGAGPQSPAPATKSEGAASPLR